METLTMCNTQEEHQHLLSVITNGPQQRFSRNSTFKEWTLNGLPTAINLSLSVADCERPLLLQTHTNLLIAAGSDVGTNTHALSRSLLSFCK